MDQKIIIVLDCGATNVRSVAVSESGEIIAQRSYPNKTHNDPFHNNGIIWDVDEIWDKLKKATREIIALIPKKNIIGITITSFGVDGAPFDKNGKQLYPVISWACQRTNSILEDLYSKVSLQELYEKSGVNHFHFNTIYKMFWLKKHKEKLMDQMHHWLFMPTILAKKLGAANYTDNSMLGTSMLADLKTRKVSKEIISKIGLEETHFPNIVEAGEIIGFVNLKSQEETDLPLGIPIIAAGHDTQFALFGSGAKINEAVLSSGTWEILMMRTKAFKTNKKALDNKITIEFDAQNGVLNPGIQWLGSGVLEWIKNSFYNHEKDQGNIYDIMISEAKKSEIKNIKFSPQFIDHHGSIEGLNMNTTRGEIYRAALVALAEKTKISLDILEELSAHKVEKLIIVGGGAKNMLWNDLRKEKLGIEIITNPQSESTVLGAAMFAFTSCGLYPSADHARESFFTESSKSN